MLLRRGNEMLAIGDISGARLLFRRAADAGNPAAMITLGQTYDPEVLSRLRSQIRPDPATAAEWYQRAAASGSPEAAALLQRVQRFISK